MYVKTAETEQNGQVFFAGQTFLKKKKVSNIFLTRISFFPRSLTEEGENMALINHASVRITSNNAFRLNEFISPREQADVES